MEATEIITTTTNTKSPVYIYLASLGSDNSRRAVRNSLNKIAGLIGFSDCFSTPWEQLRYEHTTVIRAKLAEAGAPQTANLALCCLRRTLKEAWKLGLMSAEDYNLAASVESVKAERLPAGRSLTSGEMAALVAACENDGQLGIRDAAMIVCMYAGGLRREETVNLDLEHLDRANGTLHVVRGKRRKARLVYLEDSGALRAIDDWLEIRGSDPGPLFWPGKKGGFIPRRMTPEAIYQVLKRRAKDASISTLSPHDLRRTFVSDLLDAGADISTVARMAGHVSVTTTQRYDRRPEQAKRKAAGLLHVPYRGKS